MHYPSLRHFLRDAPHNGPMAMVFAEDPTELDSTLRHHLTLGFARVVLLAPDGFDIPRETAAQILRVRFDMAAGDDYIAAINQVIRAAPQQWIYYCFNAEYLFYPFCETRSVGEMLAFHTEEQRDAMLTYVIDLYAADLDQHPDAVSPDTAHLDKSGYYALARTDAQGQPQERQLDFFGGLRWRYEDYIPPEKRRIDRISLFRARPGLMLNPDHCFNTPEYNTYACPWHNNLTAAIMSFRTAKALKRNPASSFDIHSFRWRNSTPFLWQSRQLMDLGLIEPGQWF